MAIKSVVMKLVYGAIVALKLTAVPTNAEKQLRLLDMEKYSMARCLDGSPGAFAYWPSTSEESKNKWVIFHTGGGWCSLDIPFGQKAPTDHCGQRRETNLGSTTEYPEYLPTGWTIFGPEQCLSDNPEVNGLMHDWNKVVLMYCDGNSFSGQVTEPIAYQYPAEADAVFGKESEFDLRRRASKESLPEGVIDYTKGAIEHAALHYRDPPTAANSRPLYLRGKYILDAVIDTLLSPAYGLASATDVVITGSSAGGLATMLHADHWRNRIVQVSTSKLKIVAVPESGFFTAWDLSNSDDSAIPYNELLRRNFHTFNVSGSSLSSGLTVSGRLSPSINMACVISRTKTLSDPSDCMLSEHVAPFVSIPMLLLQSVVDAWSLGNIVGRSESDDVVNKFRYTTSARILDVMRGRDTISGFIDSCEHHCGGWNTLVIDGLRKSEAFAQWYKHGFHEQGASTNSSSMMWWQGHTYPCPECCTVKPGETLTQNAGEDYLYE